MSDKSEEALVLRCSFCGTLTEERKVCFCSKSKLSYICNVCLAEMTSFLLKENVITDTKNMYKVN